MVFCVAVATYGVAATTNSAVKSGLLLLLTERTQDAMEALWDLSEDDAEYLYVCISLRRFTHGAAGGKEKEQEKDPLDGIWRKVDLAAGTKVKPRTERLSN